MKAKICNIFLSILFFVLAISIAYRAQAYGPVAHLYVADRVLDDIKSGKANLPPGIEEDILNNPDAFRAGALGPDMLNGQLSHTKDAAGIAERLMAAAVASNRAESLAYAYGYLVHMSADMKGHPLVNQYAGGKPYDYDEEAGMMPEVTKNNPNYLHVYAEGAIDKLIWANMRQEERNKMSSLLTIMKPGQPPKLFDYISPDTINMLVKAVNQPGVTATNVFEEATKPISAFNGETAQNQVTDSQELLMTTQFQNDKGEIFANVNSAVVSSEDFMRISKDPGFMNLDNGKSLSMEAIEEFFRQRSNMPDGSIDPKYLDRNGKIILKYQQQLMNLLEIKYPQILQMSPDKQKEALIRLGKGPQDGTVVKGVSSPIKGDSKVIIWKLTEKMIDPDKVSGKAIGGYNVVQTINESNAIVTNDRFPGTKLHVSASGNIPATLTSNDRIEISIEVGCETENDYCCIDAGVAAENMDCLPTERVGSCAKKINQTKLYKCTVPLNATYDKLVIAPFAGGVGQMARYTYTREDLINQQSQASSSPSK